MFYHIITFSTYWPQSSFFLYLHLFCSEQLSIYPLLLLFSSTAWALATHTHVNKVDPNRNCTFPEVTWPFLLCCDSVELHILLKNLSSFFFFTKQGLLPPHYNSIPLSIAVALYTCILPLTTRLLNLSILGLLLLDVSIISSRKCDN